MKTCIVADPGVMRLLDEEGKRDGQGAAGFLSFFVLPLPLAGLGLVLPKADLFVLPAELFLDLDEKARPCPVFAYGQVGLMADSFRLGALDFLRSHWGLEELSARALRLLRLRFDIGDCPLEISAGRLASATMSLSLSESEFRLGRILALNLNKPVPRRALSWALWGSLREASRATDVHISSLRGKLEALHPGGGAALTACRGEGYRLRGEPCG